MWFESLRVRAAEPGRAADPGRARLARGRAGGEMEESDDDELAAELDQMIALEMPEGAIEPAAAAEETAEATTEETAAEAAARQRHRCQGPHNAFCLQGSPHCIEKLIHLMDKA